MRETRFVLSRTTKFSATLVLQKRSMNPTSCIPNLWVASITEPCSGSSPQVGGDNSSLGIPAPGCRLDTREHADDAILIDLYRFISTKVQNYTVGTFFWSGDHTHVVQGPYVGHKPHLGRPYVSLCSESRRPQEFNSFIVVPTNTSRGCIEM